MQALYLEVLERETGKLFRIVHPYDNKGMFLKLGEPSAKESIHVVIRPRQYDGGQQIVVTRKPRGMFSEVCRQVDINNYYQVAASILNLPSDVDINCLKTMIEFENLCRTNESRWAASEMMGLGTESYEKIGAKIDKIFEKNGLSVDDLTTYLYGGKQHFAG